MKKILISIVFILILSRNIKACQFHEAIPEISTDKFIDSYYYELPTTDSEVMNSLTTDENYLYIIQTTDFIYVETLLQDISGVYALDGEAITAINQSPKNLTTVVVTFNDGTVLEIDSLHQNTNHSNALFLDSELEKGYGIKSEYMFLYEKETFNEKNDQFLNVKEPPIISLRHAITGFLLFIPILIIFFLKRKERRNGD